MNVKKVGIVSYGAGIPVCRLKVQDVINVWKNTVLKLVEIHTYANTSTDHYADYTVALQHVRGG